MSLKAKTFAAFVGALMLTALPCAQAQSGELVIVRNGQTLEFEFEAPDAPDPQILVREGETILIVSRGGSVTNVEGPYVGPLSAAVQRRPNSFLARIGRLLGQSRWRTTWGGTRSGAPRGEADHLPLEADLLDLTASRTTSSQRQCISRRGVPRLWRNSGEEAQSALISTPGQPASTVRFRSGERSVDWPAFLPLLDDALYYVSYADESAPTQAIRLVKVSEPRSQSELVRVLLAQGCEDQASLAMDRLLAERGDVID